jgi:hypothetical protein
MSKELLSMNHVHLIATSNDEADRMEANVKAAGGHVTRTTVWHGVVPEGSYTQIDECTRMATAEFFFLRKCAQLSDSLAVALGTELCGYYATSYTIPSLPAYAVVPMDEQRTTKDKLRAYLNQCPDAPECQHALDILDAVKEGIRLSI